MTRNLQYRKRRYVVSHCSHRLVAHTSRCPSQLLDTTVRGLRMSGLHIDRIAGVSVFIIPLTARAQRVNRAMVWRESRIIRNENFWLSLETTFGQLLLLRT